MYLNDWDEIPTQHTVMQAQGHITLKTRNQIKGWEHLYLTFTVNVNYV